MLLPIYIYGSAVLRKESEDIAKDYPGLDKFLENLWETMYEADGVGLAAPQVGRNIRIFVVDASVNAGDAVPFDEGCLSLPGINERVERPSRIRIRYADENFVEHDEEFEGFAARVIQHEYDHLDGKLFIDHVSPLRRTLLKSKLAAMTKGKYKAHYPCKLVKK